MECHQWIELKGSAGIERELGRRADQRVLRCFLNVERMDEYRTARNVLMANVSRGRVRGRPSLTEVRLDGFREDGLGPQRDDGGGCLTMREKYEGVESPCACVDDRVFNMAVARISSRGAKKSTICFLIFLFIVK